METVAPVVDATVVEPDVVSETSATPAVDFPEPPLSTNKAAQLQYGALGAAHAAVAGVVALAAIRAPQGLLSPAAAVDPWAVTLLGLLAATYLRGSGVFFHLSGAASDGELLCFRHQRLAIATAMYGVLAVLSQVFGVASLQLVGLQLALAAASAAVVYSVARSAWSVHPFVSLAAEEGGNTVGGTLAVALQSIPGWFSTVAGMLLAVVTGLSLAGFVAVVFAPAPVFPQPLGAWPGEAATLDAASAGLRRLAGAGMLLAAAHAHGLMDLARQARQPPNLGATSGIKEFLVTRLQRTRDPYAKYTSPNPWSYRHLHLTFLLAAVLQAFFLLRAPSLGVDVNTDGALWGPLFASSAGGLLYGAAALTLFDWSSASELFLRLTIWSTGLVLRFFNAFVWKIQWAEKSMRK